MKWANPLHDLICPITMKKKCAGIKIPLLPHNLPPFQWTSKHQEAFDKLKHILTTAPVLAYPDYSKPFILETDASLKGLGTVLSQEDNDGNFHIISYASCTLKPHDNHMKDLCIITVPHEIRVACAQVVCVSRSLEII